MAEWVTVRSKKDLPYKSGVYVIRDGDKCLYVGKAQNLRNRFGTHQIEVGRICGRDVKFDPEKLTISYLLLPIEGLHFEEMYYIHIFNPSLNKKRR
jgi:hypothetical protein